MLYSYLMFIVTTFGISCGRYAAVCVYDSFVLLVMGSVWGFGGACTLFIGVWICEFVAFIW